MPWENKLSGRFCSLSLVATEIIYCFIFLQHIDDMISRAQERSYMAVVRLGGQALEYGTTLAIQAAAQVRKKHKHE